MTELCNRLRAISSQNLNDPHAPERPSGGASNERAPPEQSGQNIDEAEELERRTGDTFDHNATIKEELKTLSSGSPALHRSSPAKASSPNQNNTKNLTAENKRTMLKNQ